MESSRGGSIGKVNDWEWEGAAAFRTYSGSREALNMMSRAPTSPAALTKSGVQSRWSQSTMITAGPIRRTAAGAVSSGAANDTVCPVVSTSNPSKAEISSSRARMRTETDSDIDT